MDTDKKDSPLNIKWLAIILLVTTIIYAVSSFIYYSHVRQSATTDAKYSSVTSPESTGLAERFAFTSTLVNIFLPASLASGAFLLILILEIILVYRLIVTRETTSRSSKIVHLILYQIFVVVAFFGIFLVGTFATAGILTNQAAQYISSYTGYKEILAGNVTTDTQAVDSLIKSDSNRIIIAQNPLLAPLALKAQKTFFEAYIVPRYVAYREGALDNKFKQYANLPYYFISPNYLIVQDKARFMKDLGYDVMRNIVVSQYGNYVMGAKPQFLVVPKEEYGIEYRQSQIKRFEGQVLDLKKIIESNNQILVRARSQLANDQSRLASLERQAETIKQQMNSDINEYDKIIKELSDPQSIAYKKSEVTVGAFIPPSKIVVQEPTDSSENLALNDLDQMIRIIVHESLHYYADNFSNKSGELEAFPYEAFTEYLALKAIGYSDSSMVYVSGYPLHMQVMSLLAQKIPLAELEKINFTQDSNLFEQDFKKYFPGSDYKEFSSLGSQIDTYWFTNGFGKPNATYIDDPLVLKAKQILKL